MRDGQVQLKSDARFPIGDTANGTIYAGVANFSIVEEDQITNAVAGSPPGTGLPVGALLTVNLAGAFFSSTAMTGYQNDISGNTDLAEVFILIHELAHLAGAAGFQDNDAGKSKAAVDAQNSNNHMIEQKCAKTLDLFGGHF